MRARQHGERVHQHEKPRGLQHARLSLVLYQNSRLETRVQRARGPTLPLIGRAWHLVTFLDQLHL